MGVFHQLIETKTAYALTTLSFNITPPPGTHSAIFYWRISAVAGNTPIADLKLQAVDPSSSQALDIDGGAFAQQTAASFQYMMVGPWFTNDSTGNARACQFLIGSIMKMVFTFDRTTGDETYSFTISADYFTNT